ncbi:MBOAT family protein [Oligoflexaceae bacterium]|nr:MBOAT family protein [Oligoflexaceae bacterium]
MLFNSYEFIFIYLPLVMLIYFSLGRFYPAILPRLFLLTASLFFYGWWQYEYLFLIISSIILNFILIKKINISHKSIAKKYLLLGVALNVLVLMYFKYIDFLFKNMSFFLEDTTESFNIALPLAISFFTFQQIACLVDSYRKTENQTLLDYAIFVTFFSQLIAGPIVHHSQMMPQIKSKLNLMMNFENILNGLLIFSLGLAKKVLIADSLRIWANQGFTSSASLSFYEAWGASLSYSFQLYFDFSGYTDMALGSALLFNIKLPVNFNSPYKSRNIQEFWRRWHITLGRFLRDYVYIPLGGGRVSEYKVCRNLMVTFLLGGIWHGAAWTFVFWGFLHGLGLIVHRKWSQFMPSFPHFISWFLTFNFVNITWVFFRAKTWKEAGNVLSAMFSSDFDINTRVINSFTFWDQNGINLGKWVSEIVNGSDCLSWVLLSLLAVTATRNSVELANKYGDKTWFITYASFIFSLSIVNMSKITEFLYFNF